MRRFFGDSNGNLITQLTYTSDDELNQLMNILQQKGVQYISYADITEQDFENLLNQSNNRFKKMKILNGQISFETINIIELTTTAQDTVQPFDGIPDVPADGVTPAVINVAIKNPDTNVIDTTANDILYVSTDRGKLSVVNVQLVSGQGSFEIRCSETIIATIKVWHPQNKYREASIKIQFRPV